MNNFNQSQEFLIYIGIGLLISLIYEFFRILRRIIKTNDLITYIEDGIYLCLSSLIIFSTIIFVSSGIIRFYMMFGIAMRYNYLLFDN